jgi:hypothetical protein
VIRKIMLKPMPKGAFISLVERYGLIAFLVSDLARNITGQAIMVDGGWTIQYERTPRDMEAGKVGRVGTGLIGVAWAAI